MSGPFPRENGPPGRPPPRARTLAALCAGAGALGAALAVAIALAAGLGETRTETIAVPVSPPPAGSPAPVSRARATGFDPAGIYAARARGVVTIYALFGDHASTGNATQGSGFVVSRDGLVLTSAHVVTTAGEGDPRSTDGASSTFVQFADGDRVDASIVGWDLFSDVAVLRVDPDDHRLSVLPLGDSARVRVGEPVAAIGSPFGEQGSLAVGVVSATGRTIAALTSEYAIVDAIQVDAPINRGNSGGPLLDARGRVIGINAQIRSSSGNAEGVGFAVPIATAQRSLRQLVETGRVSYAFAGIRADDLTPAIARKAGYGVTRGALVVAADGPAGSAGLRGSDRTVRSNGVSVRVGGDVILAVDGRPVRRSEDLVRIVAQELAAGEVARFLVFRDGKRSVVPVKLGERPLVPQS